MPIATFRTGGTSSARLGVLLGTTTEMLATTWSVASRIGAAADAAPSVVSSREMQ
jgi:hypothetical protein